MANKKITDLDAATTAVGELEIVVGGSSRRVQIYQGGWDWANASNALPTSWPVGAYGYGIGERYTIGNPDYAPDRVRILRIGSGVAETDFIIG